MLVALPPAVLTTTSFAPSLPGGVVIDSWVEELLTIVAAFPPIVTEVVVSRLVPEIVTAVPPATKPVLVLSAEMVGASAET